MHAEQHPCIVTGNRKLTKLCRQWKREMDGISVGEIQGSLGHTAPMWSGW